MIFVTVGMSDFPFDRLVRELDRLPPGLGPIVAQVGASRERPSRAVCYPFLGFDEVAAFIRSADVVVTHGGIGSIGMALLAGKRPFALPRRRAFGEAIDDHQVAFVRRMGEGGLVDVVEDPADLAEAISLPPEQRLQRAVQPSDTLGRELRRLVQLRIGPAALAGTAGSPSRAL